MSRAYRVRVAKGVEKTVHVDDKITTPLELLPILPDEQMKDTLRDELKKRDFDIEGNIARKKLEDDLVLEIDLEASEASIKAEDEEEVAITVSATKRSEQENIEERLTADLENKFKKKEKEMREAATKRLERGLADASGEIDDIVNKTTAEALKRKARSMGEIEELHEDAHGNLTIKVNI